jgi:hypothetical protein
LAARTCNLTPRQEAAALALAGGKTVKQAAKAAGCSERSVHYWQADPVFAARLAELRTQLFGAAVGQLAGLAAKATAALAKLLRAKSETVRLGTCRAILDAGARLREGVELAARMDALERRLAKGDGKPCHPSKAG